MLKKNSVKFFFPFFVCVLLWNLHCMYKETRVWMWCNLYENGVRHSYFYIFLLFCCVCLLRPGTGIKFRLHIMPKIVCEEANKKSMYKYQTTRPLTVLWVNAAPSIVNKKKAFRTRMYEKGRESRKNSLCDFFF